MKVRISLYSKYFICEFKNCRLKNNGIMSLEVHKWINLFKIF